MVMTTQETVRAVLAEIDPVLVAANGDTLTGERAVDLLDSERKSTEAARVSEHAALTELTACYNVLPGVKPLNAELFGIGVIKPGIVRDSVHSTIARLQDEIATLRQRRVTP